MDNQISQELQNDYQQNAESASEILTDMDETQEIASLVSKIESICYQGDGMESISLERWD